MSIDHGRILLPQSNGASLVIPPLGGMREAVEANLLLNKGVRVDGEPLESFRMGARKAVIQAARSYTASLGLDPGPEYDGAAPVIASGHQPEPMHPGIMFKQAVLHRAARLAGAVPMFVSVDSDEYKAENVPLPVLRGGRVAKFLFPLFPVRGKMLYETAPAEPVEDLLSRMEAMVHFMPGEKLAEPRTALLEYKLALSDSGLDVKDYVSRAVVMRRLWLSPEVDGFLEAPVSLLCGAAHFIRFAMSILGDMKRFAGVYNRSLARYRKERKLRYPANPFPDLESKDGMIEAPFWLLDGDFRKRIFAPVAEGSHDALVSEDGKLISFAGLMGGGVRIRPKAIVLSIYLRLVLCDLFIHGAGGAKYDHVTDMIIEEYYGASPPGYACATATIWPDIPVDDPEDEIALVEKKLREINHHPEKAGAMEPGMAALSEEKTRLVEQISNPNADKKALGIRISSLNTMMSGLLAGKRGELESRLGLLKKDKEEAQWAKWREYPYFLFHKESLLKLELDSV